MRDKELVLEILTQIHEATKTVMKRFKPIHSVTDFTDSGKGSSATFRTANKCKV